MEDAPNVGGAAVAGKEDDDRASTGAVVRPKINDTGTAAQGGETPAVAQVHDTAAKVLTRLKQTLRPRVDNASTFDARSGADLAIQAASATATATTSTTATTATLATPAATAATATTDAQDQVPVTLELGSYAPVLDWFREEPVNSERLEVARLVPGTVVRILVVDTADDAGARCSATARLTASGLSHNFKDAAEVVVPLALQSRHKLRVGDVARAVIVDAGRVAARLRPKWGVHTAVASVLHHHAPYGYMLPLGIISGKGASYLSSLQLSSAYLNPETNEEYIAQFGNTDGGSLLSIIHSFKPSESDTFLALRKQQDKDLSMQSVARGVQYQKEGKFADARRCYNRAMALDPKNVEAMVALGTLFTKQNKFEGAVKMLRDALSLNPDHSNATLYLEITLMRQASDLQHKDKLVEAAEVLTRAAQLMGPRRSEALNLIRSIHRTLERRAAATERATTAARATFGSMKTSSSQAAIRQRHASSSSSLSSTLHTRTGGSTVSALKSLLKESTSSSSGSGSSSSDDDSSSESDDRRRRRRRHKHRHKHRHNDNSGDDDDNGNPGDGDGDGDERRREKRRKARQKESRKRHKREKKKKKKKKKSKRRHHKSSSDGGDSDDSAGGGDGDSAHELRRKRSKRSGDDDDGGGGGDDDDEGGTRAEKDKRSHRHKKKKKKHKHRRSHSRQPEE
ncbi:hypothetical protein PTSG_00425 [Salpingoeca rosetta]|uniref:Uncharacterized protein n=1 Tax=Salpingoeca rosetta (strain ATCC 50818 / BSB-021) TaxID=946362 RepID=F2TWF9_SALR5|nr:uncharacterized protein PTSG_00425 [Salpingoeca rosetta]EGD72405.1 hypothetical protein PTSG_00425 [Salpingoeca rosetta]|eukprot:XP_004998974.1 hypothetical protein PTSG_00425 [Salpingoeca rosetta]